VLAGALPPVEPAGRRGSHWIEAALRRHGQRRTRPQQRAAAQRVQCRSPLDESERCGFDMTIPVVWWGSV
jgi:hypothetical protein